MNVRKFIAKTSRQALKEIRNELGDEAVILSNRKVEGGVEILAMLNEEINKLSDFPVRKKLAEAQFAQVALPPISTPQESVILGEIKSMQKLLLQQFSLLSKHETKQRDPHADDLLCKMLNAGFSAQLARQFIDKMPVGKMQDVAWINRVLKQNLRVAGEADEVIAKGGVYALIGPTGVGKTTTTAKLAARAVVRYGAEKVALVTTDSYRVGAYEQLKIYGKILGVEVHAVNSTEDLRLTIATLRNKHLVLIDTMGMSQRDERVSEQREMFDVVGVPCLLLLNAASSGEMLEDVVRLYNSRQVIGCIPTKLDEAVNLGAVLDVVLRHRLVLHYMTNGQCVPEDLHLINLNYLLHRALKPTERITPFSFQGIEFPALRITPKSSGVPTGVFRSNSVSPANQVEYAR